MAPLVAIVGRVLRRHRIEGQWFGDALAVPRPYVDAVARAGAVPVVVDPSTEVPVSACAGVLLLGGVDVDPARYGQERAPETYGVSPALDSAEAAAVAEARALGRPVLAVCRGVQLLNVLHGGTLDQHITGRAGLVDHGTPGGGQGVHDVLVTPGSRLAAAVGGLGVVPAVASHHHQAVARVGEGLRVVGRAPDGVVEALEPADPAGPWVVGVQWHPERTAAEDEVQQRLFDAFVTECRARS